RQGARPHRAAHHAGDRRRGDRVRRRDAMVLLGGAVVWPCVAPAQSARVPSIGFLSEGSKEEWAVRLAAYLKGLDEAGFVDGRNVTIEYRWAGGDNERLRAMAADLVRREVAVIAGSTNAALVARASTTTIPVVFATGADPIAIGFVSNLSRPDANVTGATSM